MSVMPVVGSMAGIGKRGLGEVSMWIGSPSNNRLTRQLLETMWLFSEISKNAMVAENWDWKEKGEFRCLVRGSFRVAG